jgi:hypothetical protein
MMTGALACALGLVAPQISHAQGATPSPQSGQSQVGNGNGVPSSPATQGTTDRAGQTPQVPDGKTTDQPPTGSVGVDPRIPTNSGEQNREPNADTSRDQNGNDRSKTIDRNTGATANQVDPNDPNQNQQDNQDNPDNQTPGTRRGTAGTGTVGTSGTQDPNGTSSGQSSGSSSGSSSGATGTAGSGATGTTGSGAAGTTGAGATGTPGSGTNTPSGSSGSTGSSGNSGTPGK